VCLCNTPRTTQTNYTTSLEHFIFEFVQQTAATKVMCFFKLKWCKLTLSLYFPWRLTGRVEVLQLQSFFTSALDGGK